MIFNSFCFYFFYFEFFFNRWIKFKTWKFFVKIYNNKKKQKKKKLINKRTARTLHLDKTKNFFLYSFRKKKHRKVLFRKFFRGWWERTHNTTCLSQPDFADWTRIIWILISFFVSCKNFFLTLFISLPRSWSRATHFSFTSLLFFSAVISLYCLSCLPGLLVYEWMCRVFFNFKIETRIFHSILCLVFYNTRIVI